MSAGSCFRSRGFLLKFAFLQRIIYSHRENQFKALRFEQVVTDMVADGFFGVQSCYLSQ
jgi:hypothetical protein